MFTVLLREPAGTTTPAGWMMFAGAAVVRGIAAASEVVPSLRWPNDIYVGDRKLAGILVESRRDGVDRDAIAIGVGINCLQQPGHFPGEIRDKAVSLDMLSRTAVDRTAVARSVLQSFDAGLRDALHRDESRLIDAWQEYSSDIGAHLTLMYDGHRYCGRVIDVHPRDGLLMQLDDGGRRQFDPAVTTRA